MSSMDLNQTVSHSRDEETIEAKARWFQSLSIEERVDIFCSLTDLALEVNPDLMDKKDAQPIPGRVQVISRE